MRFTKKYSIVRAGSTVWADGSEGKVVKLVNFLKNQKGSILITQNQASPTVLPLQYEVGPKPRGGLWFADGVAWADWMTTEMPDGAYDYIFKLTLGSGIFEPRSMWELDQFIETFGDPEYREKYGLDYFVDWSKVTKKYAGFNLCNSGRLGFWDRSNLFMYPWDVPSGVVWDARGMVSSRMIGYYDHEKGDYQGGVDKSKSILTHGVLNS